MDDNWAEGVAKRRNLGADGRDHVAGSVVWNCLAAIGSLNCCHGQEDERQAKGK